MERVQRVALVTGCGKPDGIGAATATRLALQGCTVVACDVQEGGRPNRSPGAFERESGRPGLSELVYYLRNRGLFAFEAHVDLTDETSITRLAEQVASQFGGVDLLINNAAAPHSREFDESIRVDVADWDAVFNVNCRGTFLMCRALAPNMCQTGWGRIVNLSSTAALMGLAKYAAYSASKAAVLALTRCLAVELGPYGVTCNAVCPGLTATSRGHSALLREGEEDFDSAAQAFAQLNPMRRVGAPTDVASLIAALCRDELGYINGQTISVDGGQLPL